MTKVTTSTRSPNALLDAALVSFPANLRRRIIKSYADLKTRALEGQYDAVGTRAGRLAEVLLRALQHRLTGSFVPFSSGISNFKAECEKLEKLPATQGAEGLRVLMPRALSFLYSLRNKRDFGHAGGEVDANAIDAGTATRVADWCISELVRVCHSIPIEDAQDLCDAIAVRNLPHLWPVMGRKRVLSTNLGYKDQVLVLLHSELEAGIATEDLYTWVEHPSVSNFRRDVLSKLHSARLIEWDRELEIAILSPTGIELVEQTILPKLHEK